MLTTFLSGRVDENDNAFLADAPGPFAGLLGLRVEETDSQQPEVRNPVLLAGHEVESKAQHVFEIVIPQASDAGPAAEVRGTYGADFYAGTPAVTRASRGKGSAWYVATSLDADGLDRVVRDVLDEHDLVGPLADLPGIEVTERVGAGGDRYLFVLHHGDTAYDAVAPVDGVDLLTSREFRRGDPFPLAPTDVLLLSVRNST